MNISEKYFQIEEQVIAQRHFFIDEQTNQELNQILKENEDIDNQITNNRSRTNEINIPIIEQQNNENLGQEEDLNSIKEMDENQNKEQLAAKNRAFTFFYKQAINDLAYGIIFHGFKFFICFLVLYFRSNSCDSNELVNWLEWIKFIEQMTILYIFTLIIYFQQKKEILKRFYFDELVSNIDDIQILNMNLNFEDHIARVKAHLIKSFKTYRILHFLFNKLSNFFQQLLLIAGNCIYLKFEQTDCDINIQWGVFLMLVIGYVFQSAFLACFIMTIASMIVWIPSFACYLIYTAYKYFVNKQKIKKASQNVQRIIIKNLLNMENEDCMICFENFKKKEEIYILPCNQKHIFHSKCINQWFTQHLNCPICRKSI
ncbi:hypothetical protein ABPG72_001354 [Tetrahymena utriculariae]